MTDCVCIGDADTMLLLTQMFALPSLLCNKQGGIFVGGDVPEFIRGNGNFLGGILRWRYPKENVWGNCTV